MADKRILQAETEQARAASMIRAMYERTVPPGARRGNWRSVADQLGQNVGTVHAFASGKRHIPVDVLVRLGVRQRKPKTLHQMSRVEIKAAFDNRRNVSRGTLVS